MSKVLLPLTLLALLVAAPQWAAAPSRHLKTICLGALDDGLNGERFRDILRDEFAKGGIEVTASRDRADAILSGGVSNWSEWGGSFNARLDAPNGKLLWHGSVPRAIRSRKSHCDDRDTATALAQSIVHAVSKVKIPASAG